MIIFGETLNSTSRSVKNALLNHDIEAVQQLAIKQQEAGAHFIDINTGAFGSDESEKMVWLMSTIQQSCSIPFSIDTLHPSVMKRALEINQNGRPVLNSMTYQKQCFDDVLPLVSAYHPQVIALCMDDSGMPETVEERLDIANRLVDKLLDHGIKMEDIFLDPMVRPIGADARYGIMALESIRRLRALFPSIHITCGISNISFGISARKVLNRSFLSSAMTAGLDSAILDVLDRDLMMLVYAGEALLGRDEFCMNYQMKCREGLLE